MTTARELITQALKEATVLGVGQTALAQDMNDGLVKLRQMVAQWQKRRWMVPALMDISKPGNNQKSNTIGTGGYWNYTRPSDIKGGYVVQLNTGQTPVSLQLTKIFSYEDYINIAVKELNSLPTHFFYDNAWENGLGNIFVWPIPSAIYEIHLLIERQLDFPNDSLDTVFELPLEYEEAIVYNLAIRFISSYSVQNPSPQTGVLAKVALNTIKKANTQIATLKTPRGLRKGKAFSLWNPDGY